MSELKNCPFCGAQAEYIYTNYSGNEIEDLAHGVRCTNETTSCALQFVFDSTKEKVISLWNAREPQIESLTAQLEEAKENQRIAVEALEDIIALKDSNMRSWNDFILIAEQALSTIRGK